MELAGTLQVQDGEARQRRARFRDMAVLVRTTAALAPVVAALHEFGVPYLAEGGRTFYEAREVRDLVHLLQAIANPENELALAGVLRSPLVGAGDETLLRMKQQTANLAQALSRLDALGAASCDAEDLERLRRFAALLAGLRRERDDVSPDRLLMRAMDACDYESGLDGRQRANVAKFLVQVRERHSAKPEPLEALLADIEWLRAAAAEAEAPPGDSSDVVRIMTMHKSKGLEFPVVFLPALHRGTGGAGPSIRLSPDGSLGAWWRNPVTGQGVKDLSYQRTTGLLSERERREEKPSALCGHDARGRAPGVLFRHDRQAAGRELEAGQRWRRPESGRRGQPGGRLRGRRWREFPCACYARTSCPACSVSPWSQSSRSLNPWCSPGPRFPISTIRPRR